MLTQQFWILIRKDLVSNPKSVFHESLRGITACFKSLVHVLRVSKFLKANEVIVVFDGREFFI
jgi:hypothetical protein